MLSRKLLGCFLFTLLLVAPYIPQIIKAQDIVELSPGEYDYPLGEGFPREDRVKLDYPKSTILTNSTGELLFNVTLTTFNYTSSNDQESIPKSISIYIPPEFVINNGVESVWTSFTNDYSSSSLFLSTAFSNDPIAPNWSVLRISNLVITKSQQDVQNRIFIENKTQYIRVFNVTSPSVAGRYFFKVFITAGIMTHSIGSHNFPTIVVKAALNPAYISGVVRYGDSLRADLYGEPLDATVHPDGTVLLPEGYGGRVYAEGLTAQGRKVRAQAYFNATAGGRYTLYGLAEATYNLTVQAAGYPPQTFLDITSVVRGQSYEHLDLFITEGVTITGTLFSKHGYGEVPWGYSYNLTSSEVKRVVRVDVTDLDENMVASSPLRLYDKLFLVFRPRDTLDPFSSMYHFSLMREVSFDGHIPQDYANYTSGIPSGDWYVKAHIASYVQLDPAVVHVNNDTRKVQTVIDMQRTGYFEVTVHFKHQQGSLKPVPTIVGGYLYLEVLDKAGAVVGFNTSHVPVGSRSFTMEVRGIDIWSRLMSDQSKRTAWAYSHDRGLLPGTYTINALFMNQTVDFIAINALIVASPQLRAVFPTTTEPLVEAFPSRTLEATNRETPVYMQLDMIKASTGGFCDSASTVSFELVEGGGYSFTLYPVDWQRPPINREWAHPESEIRIDIYTSQGDRIDTLRALQPPLGKSITISTLGEIKWEDGTMLFGRALGLKSGTYIMKMYTPGYLEDPTYSPITIPVTLGERGDTRVNLLRGATIDLTVVFRTEHLLDPIDNKLLYAHPLNNIDATPVRVEVFDGFGEFVAANITYVKKGSGNIRVLLDGFNRYYGNPRVLWTNFYDTTDTSGQQDSGLEEGTYHIRVSIEGYYQRDLLTAEIFSGKHPLYPTVSLITSVERLGYLSGHVVWENWCTRSYPLSWATITAYTFDNRKETYTFSLDGVYEMWLPEGDYDFGLYHPGFPVRYFTVGLHVGWGSSTSITFKMN